MPCTTERRLPARSAVRDAADRSPIRHNPYVDRTGTAPEFTRCVNTIDAVPTREQTISALAPTRTWARSTCAPAVAAQIELGHGQNVVDIDALRIGQDGGLTIKGFADTVVVFRIAGAFRIGTRSDVDAHRRHQARATCSGWSRRGPLRRASAATRTFAGTLFAAKRPKISIGAFTHRRGRADRQAHPHGPREPGVMHWPVHRAARRARSLDSPNLADPLGQPALQQPAAATPAACASRPSSTTATPGRSRADLLGSPGRR